jgi:membrane peptidoglycan carboxypeptidase
MLGIGQKTGVDLPHEMNGIMPSEEWKIRTQKQRWYPGEVISVGIGQGAVTVTPIQIMRAISGIMMGGTLEKPHVAFPEELKNYGLQQASLLVNETKFDINKDNWDTITDAMSKVPTTEGTSPSAHLEGIDFAGKTGSAQTMSNDLARKLGHSKSIGDNAWFVGVTPRRDPDLVVCVLFEGGEHGQFAARIAAQVVKAFVDKQRAKTKDQTLYRASAAPGLESVPAASPALLAAMKANPDSIPAAERDVIARSSRNIRVTLAGDSRKPATPDRRLATAFEMAGFWGEPGGEEGERLKAGTFKVKLTAPIATSVH